MLNSVIRFSLHNRLLVLAGATVVMALGAWQAINLPIDVFPDLNRPRVVVMVEAPGMAPEEVESLITIPIESALNGATGVEAVRSSSGVGLAVIYVEFDWDTDILADRQIVTERLALAADRLPAGVQPQLAPISSIMGQIMVVGMFGQGGETTPMELRTLADWVVRQRLLTIPGVAQVFVMGGGRKQFQVLVDPAEMLRYGVTLSDIKQALSESNQNTAGGYLQDQGPEELLVRAIGRVQTLDELRGVVVTIREGRSIRLGQVARVVEAPQVKRGDSSAFRRNAQGKFEGGPAVVLTINKQPDADTRRVTDDIQQALLDLKLPKDVTVVSDLYQQKSFIDLAVENVIDALRDGGILVVVILFLFLLNLRTTFITLTAIPLSIAVTALVFRATGMSINTMTLGGLAVAIGELVDDAIVDVENIFRRLRENRHAASPRSALQVVYEASVEVRSSIVYGTLIVILVFVPLFALGGMEGRLFTPLGIAYIVSIVSSLAVSLTVTPVLSYWLLPRARVMAAESDAALLRGLKRLAGAAIGASLRTPRTLLTAAAVGVVAAVAGLWTLERDFLPPFNEGAVQINVVLPPGASLATSEEISRQVEQRLQQVPDVTAIVRRTGRAELDEHAEGVNTSEIIATLDPESPRSREETLADLREALASVPGVGASSSVEQPIAHLISHMLSGVKAQIGVKIYGDDLNELRRIAKEMEAAIADVPGVRDLQVEPQVLIPQLRIEIDGQKLQSYGLHRNEINEFIETAMQGHVVSQVLEGQRMFDLIVRLDDPYREDIDALRRLSIELPGGGTTKLENLARIYESGGPNTINREQVRRRIVLQANTAGRGLVDVVDEIQQKVQPIRDALPPGYLIEFGGQFESQRSASRQIAALFAVSLVGMFLVLHHLFRSANLALQVMAALPAALLGSVAALYLTGQTLTVAAMVGFISLCGIASRNGILLINHYLHLVEYEGETWSPAMIIRAGQERLAPVLMTALTSGIGLAPLALAAGEPGKEILYPVATVIIGGLTTSTLLEFLVRPALFWTFGLRAAERTIETEPESLDALAAGSDETLRPTN